MKSTLDMVKDYLKSHFYVEEIILPYHEVDGRILFFINKYKIQQEIENRLRKEVNEDWESEHPRRLRKAMQEVIREPIIDESEKSNERKIIEERYNKLRTEIAEEEKMQVTRIIEEKFYESVKMRRTKGIYKTLEDMLKEKNPEGKYTFEEWQKKDAPNLYNLEQGIYVEDSCKGEPKCGYCGDYIFLREKRENEREDVAKLLITNLEQAELMEDDIGYIFDGKADKFPEEISRFKFLMLTRLGKPFRDRFNAQQIILRDNEGKELLENWEIYKNIGEVKIDFEKPYAK